MSNLIPINYDNDRQAVIGRDLHNFLEIGKDYTTWAKDWMQYDFTSGVDFETFYVDKNGDSYFQGIQGFNEIDSMSGAEKARNGFTTNHQISIDCAKEICMLARTEKGKQARQYFIELEKQWNTPEAVFARALKMANAKLLDMKNNVITLETKVKELTPAAEFGNAIGNCQEAILMGDFAKTLANDGMKIGRDRLFAWMQYKKYIYRDSDGQLKPYQKYVDQGLFKLKETVFSTNTHGDKIKVTIKVTGKGQKYFYEKLKEKSA